MITKKGNILTSVKEGFIIHGCNAQGVMGSGIAVQIKNQYPEAFQKYRDIYLERGLILGEIIPVKVTDKLCIINAITQKYYGSDPTVLYANYRAIQDAFTKTNRFIQESNLPKQLNFPKIGAGRANGKWSLIKEIIDFQISNSINKTLWIL